jgi:hypothetical protein
MMVAAQTQWASAIADFGILAAKNSCVFIDSFMASRANQSLATSVGLPAAV